jgi:hypothetical protein
MLLDILVQPLYSTLTGAQQQALRLVVQRFLLAQSVRIAFKNAVPHMA